MTTPTLEFPRVIDNSLMKLWRSCRRKAHLEGFQHWKPRLPNVNLHAGAAFAKGCEIARRSFYDDGLDEESAEAAGLGALLAAYGGFECPPESPKSADRVAAAFEYMLWKYPLSTEAFKPVWSPALDRHAIEYSFAEPLDILHPTSGDPLLYCGRFDMITEFGGQLFGFDDKTTKQMGPTWASQWDLDPQFTGYCWGGRRAGLPLEGFIIQGVSIQKTQNKAEQAITYRPQWLVDEWYESLLADLREMIAVWQSGGVWRPNFDSCANYGGCSFRKVCQSPEPIKWLEGSFVRRKWDPVTRTETLIEDQS